MAEESQKESRSTVRTFAAASFLNDFGSDAIYPIWPFFVSLILTCLATVLSVFVQQPQESRT